MVGQNIVDFFAEQAIKILPPEIFGLVIFVLIIIYMAISRLPRGASTHIGFIFVLSFSTLLGGVFSTFLVPVLYSITIASFLYGGWKFFTR